MMTTSSSISLGAYADGADSPTLFALLFSDSLLIASDKLSLGRTLPTECILNKNIPARVWFWVVYYIRPIYFSFKLRATISRFNRSK